jgi:outer membrane protein OmpA-like peptidoglycan-associated protein
VTSRCLLLALALLFAAPLAAQEVEPPAPSGFPPGSMELGLFGQYTTFSHELFSQFNSRSALGFGGRAGLFVTRWLSVEFDIVTANPRLDGPSPPGNSDYTAYAVRANYNFAPAALPDDWSLVAGAGLVSTKFSIPDPDSSESATGISLVFGGRWQAYAPFAVRVDGVLDYMPDTKNLNIGLRAGAGVVFDASRAFGFRRPRNGAPGTVAAPAPPPPAPETPVMVDPPPTIELSPAATAALLEPIFFDYESAAIRADAAAILDSKLPWLRANPHVQLRLEGHADDRGADEFNVALGQQRTSSTRSWLVEHGISPARLQVLSYGEERKLCAQEPMTEPCHQQNRRVEFRIISTR